MAPMIMHILRFFFGRISQILTRGGRRRVGPFPFMHGGREWQGFTLRVRGDVRFIAGRPCFRSLSGCPEAPPRPEQQNLQSRPHAHDHTRPDHVQVFFSPPWTPPGPRFRNCGIQEKKNTDFIIVPPSSVRF